MKFKSNIEIQAGLEDASGSPGTVNQLLSSTVTGTAWIDPSTIVAEAATLVVIACKNTSGAAIAQGTPVYQTGTVGATATIEIAPADALISANKLPAIGLLQTALNNNGFGFVVITGELTNFTTSPIDGVVPTTGDKVFVKSGGGLTLTKPTGEGNGIQNMGLVGKVSTGSAGSITVSSIMRTNDVPNLPEGRIWVGDGNTIVSDTVYLDEPNERMGIGTTSPGAKLEVSNGSSGFAGSYNGRTASVFEGSNSAGTTISIMSPDTGYSGIFFGNNTLETYGQLAFEHASNSFKFINGGGTERMRIKSNGFVGIGTTNPTRLLSISNNDATTTPQLLITQNGSGDAVIGFNRPGYQGWAMGVDSSIGNNFQIHNSSGGVDSSSQLAITPGGNVGIGATSPNVLGFLETGLNIAAGSSSSTTLQQAGLVISGSSDSDDADDFGYLSFTNYQSTLSSDRVAEIRINKGGSNVNTGRFNFYTANGTALNESMVLGETGLLKLSQYGAGTLVSDASGNITVSSGGGAGGPFLPLAGGTMTGNIVMSNNIELRWKDNGGTERTVLELDSSNNLYLGKSGGGTVNIVSGTSYTTALSFDSSQAATFTGDVNIDSALLSNQENTDVDTGTEVVAQVAIATYTAAFFDFVIKKTTNVRSGTVYACHDGTNVEFTETSTNDLGDTSDVTLSVDISGTNMRLLATVTSDDWSVKSLIRAI